MSGGQDEASERINVGDLPYWLAGPIKRLEARVERLEEAKQQPPTDQPAKRREWWVVTGIAGWSKMFETHNAAKDYLLSGVCGPEFGLVHVIAAPSEAEIEAAVEYGCRHHAAWGVTTGQSGSIRTAIRKLLGGGE